MVQQTIFTTSGYVEPAQLKMYLENGVDFLALPPILRVLLSTDGTVTKTLEAYFWEPLDVISEKQFEIQQAELPELAIDLDADSRVLYRQVRLCGRKTQRSYASAKTYVNLSALPEPVSADLEARKIGVGEVIRESGIETFREVLRVGRTSDKRKLWRCYRILLKNQPVMQISEYFPLELYQQNSSV